MLEADLGVTAVACVSSPWDGSLICEVSVVAPWPEGLTRAPHLRASLMVQAPIPLDRLPPAPAGPAQDAPGTARRAVAAVVRELNDLLVPMIGQLETAAPAR